MGIECIRVVFLSRVVSVSISWAAKWSSDSQDPSHLQVEERHKVAGNILHDQKRCFDLSSKRRQRHDPGWDHEWGSQRLAPDIGYQYWRSSLPPHTRHGFLEVNRIRRVEVVYKNMTYEENGCSFLKWEINIEFIDSDSRRHTITIKISYIAGRNKINWE